MIKPLINETNSKSGKKKQNSFFGGESDLFFQANSSLPQASNKNDNDSLQLTKNAEQRLEANVSSSTINTSDEKQPDLQSQTSLFKQNQDSQTNNKDIDDKKRPSNVEEKLNNNLNSVKLKHELNGNSKPKEENIIKENNQQNSEIQNKNEFGVKKIYDDIISRISSGFLELNKFISSKQNLSPNTHNIQNNESIDSEHRPFLDKEMNSGKNTIRVYNQPLATIGSNINMAFSQNAIKESGDNPKPNNNNIHISKPEESNTANISKIDSNLITNSNTHNFNQLNQLQEKSIKNNSTDNKIEKTSTTEHRKTDIDEQQAVQKNTPSGKINSSLPKQGDIQPTLDKWKGKVLKSTAQISGGGLSSLNNASKKMEVEGKNIADGYKSDKKNHHKNLKSKIKPSPKPENPPPPPEPDPVPLATKLVEDASNKKLSDQVLPKVLRSPGHPKINGGLGVYPTLTPQLHQDERNNPIKKEEEAAPTTPIINPNKQKLEEGLNKKPLQKEEDIQPKAAVFQDKGAPAEKPISKNRKEEIENVLIKLLSKKGDLAGQFVELANTSAYPHGILKEVEGSILEALKKEEETSIENHLVMIGESAQITKEALKEKVKSVEEKTGEAKKDADLGVSKKAGLFNGLLSGLGQNAIKLISTAGENVENEIIAKQEATGGQVDTKLIEAKRDRLLEKLDEKVVAAQSAFKYALETRKKELTEAGTKQAYAYQLTAQNEASKIRALYQDFAEGRLESKPTIDWGEHGRKTTNDQVELLKLAADREKASFETSLILASLTAREKVRAWADAKMGKERSWWDRILDMIKDWVNQSLQEKRAFEAAEAKIARDELNGDFDKIEEVKQALAQGNKQLAEQIMHTLSSEEKAVITAFFGNGGDSISAVATGLLLRMQQKRVPILKEEAVKKSLNIDDWEKLDKLGRAQNANFHARTIARNVYDAVAGWGTNEDKIYSNLNRLTQVQSAAVRKLYPLLYGESIESALKGDLSGEEEKRAIRLLEGDQIGAEIAALHYAVDGLGTKESTIYSVLRGKSPAELEEIKRRYKEEYGSDLDTVLEGEMSGLELKRGNALLEGNVAKADAIGLQDAMESGWFGADVEAADAIYSQIQQEVDSEATDNGWSSVERDAEIKSRNGQVANEYGKEFAQGNKEALKKALNSKFEGPERDLLIGLHEYNPAAIDAARLRMETDNVFVTSDDKVNAILRNQHERASKNANLDFGAKLSDLQQKAAIEKWPPDKIKEARENLSKAREKEIEVNSKKHMEAFTKQYEGQYNRFIVLDLAKGTSGYSQDMAFDLLAQNGKLSPAQEIHYAIAGPGTEEMPLKNAVEGKTKKEIEAIKIEYKNRYGTDMEEDINDDTSGRDEKDMEWLLRGKPETKEEMLALLKEKQKWEKENGRGIIGGLLGAASTEEHVLDFAIADTQHKYDRYQEAVREFGADSLKALELEKDFYRVSGYVEGDIEQYRKGVDRVADYASTAAELTVVVAGVVAGAIFTGGTASAGILALYAGATAAAAATAGIAARAGIKGDAYGWEDVAADAAIGGADVAASMLTFGMSKAILAGSKMAKLAEGSIGKRLVAHFLAEGIEGATGAIPPTLAATLINEDTWKSDNPFAAILLGTAMGTGMGLGLGGGLGSLGGLKKSAKNLASNIDLPTGQIFDPKTGKKVAQLPEHNSIIDTNGIATPHKVEQPTIPSAKLISDENIVPGSIGDNAPNKAGGTIESSSKKPMHELADVEPALKEGLSKNIIVKKDPDLVGRSVEIHYDLDANNLVHNIHLRVGAGATAADIKAHARTIRQMKQYSGVVGRSAQLLEKVNLFIKYAGDPPVGSKAWEAKFELDKLDRILKSRLKQLVDNSMSAQERESIEFEINDLQQRLSDFEKVLIEMDTDPGQGFVASKDWVDRNKTELEALFARGSSLPVPEKYPDLDALLKDYNTKVYDDGTIALSRKQKNNAPELVVVYPKDETSLSKATIELKVENNLERIEKLNPDLIANAAKEPELLPPGISDWASFRDNYNIHRSNKGEFYIVRKDSGEKLPSLDLVGPDGKAIHSDAELQNAIIKVSTEQRLALGTRKEKLLLESPEFKEKLEDLPIFEQGLASKKGLTLEDKAWIRRKGEFLKLVLEGKSPAKQKEMVDELLQGATAGFGDKFDSQFRKTLRQYALEHLFEKSAPRIDLIKQQELLKKYLDADDYLKGELFRQYNVELFNLPPGAVESSELPFRTVHGDKDALKEFFLSESGRKADLAVEKTGNDISIGLPSEKGRYAVDSKAGPEAFRPDQFADYLLGLASDTVSIKKGGKEIGEVKGLIYIADTLENAQGAVKKLETDHVMHEKIIQLFQEKYKTEAKKKLEAAFSKLYFAGHDQGELKGIDLEGAKNFILSKIP